MDGGFDGFEVFGFGVMLCLVDVGVFGDVVYVFDDDVIFVGEDIEDFVLFVVVVVMFLCCIGDDLN